VYTKPAPYNLVASVDEVKTLDFNGGIPITQALFTPGLGSSTAPSTYTTKAWRAAVNEDYLTGDLKGYANKFEANKKELFPIPTSVINTNYNMVQNNGY
jgi:hypothetical protein